MGTMLQMRNVVSQAHATTALTCAGTSLAGKVATLQLSTEMVACNTVLHLEMHLFPVEVTGLRRNQLDSQVLVEDSNKSTRERGRTCTM